MNWIGILGWLEDPLRIILYILLLLGTEAGYSTASHSIMMGNQHGYSTKTVIITLQWCQFTLDCYYWMKQEFWQIIKQNLLFEFRAKLDLFIYSFLFSFLIGITHLVGNPKPFLVKVTPFQKNFKVWNKCMLLDLSMKGVSKYFDCSLFNFIALFSVISAIDWVVSKIELEILVSYLFNRKWISLLTKITV